VSVRFDPGLDIGWDPATLDFRYGEDVFGPIPEKRSLEAIRGSLREPDCEGPPIVYSIAMDVGKKGHARELRGRMLLFGVVTYAAGRLGSEPVRSQGHVHRISSHSGWSPPELYEIWSGRACIYMQERVADDPGRCFAVHAGPGDVVVVPPGWAHATISADPKAALTFGAWCDREYGFEYDAVRSRRGLAWYPSLLANGTIEWVRNERYMSERDGPIVRTPKRYEELDVRPDIPIYRQFEEEPGRFQWVSKPARKSGVWESFEP
jgi:glucose-6-phosphate isomerase